MYMYMNWTRSRGSVQM